MYETNASRILIGNGYWPFIMVMSPTNYGPLLISTLEFNWEHAKHSNMLISILNTASGRLEHHSGGERHISQSNKDSITVFRSDCAGSG